MEETEEVSEADSVPHSPGLLEQNGDGTAENAGVPQSSQTNLEAALPQIKSEQEAIDEYEAHTAVQFEDVSDAKIRLGMRKWIKGKSSIYVDAFNLALDTVLDEEKHLFNEAELALFQHWQNLNYEMQYLSVT